MQAYIIGIAHNHGGEFSTTLGYLEAESAEDAEERALFWIRRKTKEHDCKKGCIPSVHPAIGLHGIGLLASAEEIGKHSEV